MDDVTFFFIPERKLYPILVSERELPFLGLLQEIDVQTPTPAHSAQSNSEKPSLLSELLCDFENPTDKSLASVNFSENEITRYLTLPPCPMDGNPILWWKSYAHTLPLLARLALPHLCIQATSVASERMFSTAGDIVTKKRNRLNPKMVNMIMFLNKNYRLLEQAGVDMWE